MTRSGHDGPPGGPGAWRRRLAALNRPVALVLAAVAVATVVAVGPGTLVGADTFSTVDVLTAFEPWRTFVDAEPTNTAVTDPVNAIMPKWDEATERLREGDLPLWSSLLATGTPLATLLQRGMLSPINLPRYLLPQAIALGWIKLLELAVAGGFTYLFLRRLGLGRIPGILAGFLFAFSGFQVAWQGWQHTQVAAFIPVVFWAVERAVQESDQELPTVRRLAAAIPVALATTGIIVAGFPSLAMWTLQAAGVYALVRVIATRDTWQERARDLGVLAGAVAAGVALAGVQVLPFADWFGDRAIGDRSGFADDHLPFSAMATLVAPEAFGNPSEQLRYGGPFIGYQAYVGVAALALAVTGAVFGSRASDRRRGARGFMIGAAGVLTMFVFFGGPVLEALAGIPPYGSNLVTRQRVILAFLVAGLAGIGLHWLLHHFPERWRLTRARLRTVLAAGGAVAVALALALRGAGRAAAAEGAPAADYFRGEVVEVVAVAAVVAAGFALLRYRRDVALTVIAGAVILPAVLFATDYWATPDRDLHYPTTPAHEFLQDNLGPDRVAAVGRSLEPGATEVYGIASITSHGFQLLPVAELLNSVTRGALARHSFPMLAPGEKTATSPVLDRLGVRYYVAPDTEPVLGDRPAEPTGDGEIRFEVGEELARPAPGGPLRAVTLDVLRISAPDGGQLWVEAELAGSDGTVLARGLRRVHGRVRPGPFDVGLVWEDGAGPRPAPEGARLRVTVTGTGGFVDVAAADGVPVVAPVEARDDGLRLVFATGVHIYDRLDALPRIRWATHPIVETDRGRRIRGMREGRLAPDDVTAEVQPPPNDRGAAAELTVVEPFGDVLEVGVDAEGAGLLVVADTLTEDGWSATVDGEPARIYAADHAGAAVHVPAGTHTVRFVYSPGSLRTGLAITVLAAIALAGVAVAARRRAR